VDDDSGRLATAALRMAVAVRGGKDNIDEVIMHTDQGSEYTAKNFQAACGRVGVTQSMGRVGSALDSAVIESWHSTVEFELRQLEHFTTRVQARQRVAAWIEEYNHDRRPPPWGCVPPSPTSSPCAPMTSPSTRSTRHEQPDPAQRA